jgi:hypothetical protein
VKTRVCIADAALGVELFPEGVRAVADAALYGEVV